VYLEDAPFFVEDAKFVHPTTVFVFGMDLYDFARKLLANRSQNLRQWFSRAPLDIPTEFIPSVFTCPLIAYAEHGHSEDDGQAGDVRTKAHGLLQVRSATCLNFTDRMLT
jgi:hypothetical protein